MQSRRDNFTVVPILVGSLSPDREVKYGRIFAKYLADPSNLFIISSDFCHWGKRFRYQEYDQSKGQIHESIKALDFEVSYNKCNFDQLIINRFKRSKITIYAARCKEKLSFRVWILSKV